MELPSRDQLLELLLGFLGAPTRIDTVREKVGAVVHGATDTELQELARRLQTTGSDWGYHPPDPLARRLHHAMADAVFEPGSGLEAQHHLAAAQSGPVIFFANHLSFADANLFECLMHFEGLGAIGAKLTVLAGPKVYSEPARRLWSLSLGTIKTPQSTSRASGEAVMSKREVAMLARQILGAVDERRALGDHVLVFVEGTRSRDARMQRTLDAVSRYVEDEQVRVVPLGIAGSEALVPIGDEHAHPTQVTVRIGPPVLAGALRTACEGNRRVIMDVVGLLIAQQLPPRYRGAYADDAEGLAAARSALGRIQPEG